MSKNCSKAIVANSLLHSFAPEWSLPYISPAFNRALLQRVAGIGVALSSSRSHSFAERALKRNVLSSQAMRRFCVVCDAVLVTR